MSAPRTQAPQDAAVQTPPEQADSDPPSERIQELGTIVQKHHATYVETVTRAVEALSDQLAQLRDRHAAICEELALDGRDLPDTAESGDARDGNAEAWRELWQSVCRYRGRLREEILAPLRAHLDASAPGQALEDARRSLVEALRVSVEALPEEVTRPEPDTLYASDPDDSWLLRGWKGSVRVRRRLGALLPGQASDRQQSVPLRRLARRHVQRRLRARHPSVLGAVEDRVMGWMALMERTATTATHTLLDYERRLDHLDFHHVHPEQAPPAPPGVPFAGPGRGTRGAP